MKNEYAWLMHGDVRVARLGFDINGLVRAVDAVSNPQHLPVSAIGFESDNLIERISRWWTKRAIPASRYRLNEVLAELRMNTPEYLMMKSLGLSLSDCYWINPIGSQLSWDDVNYFKNDFSSDFGDLLIEDKKILEPLLESPDTSLNGYLKKRWKIIDGNRVLLKGGSLPYLQEPFNEVIASEIMSRLDVDHIEYRLNSLYSEPYCACPCFCDENTEFIPAWDVMSAEIRGGRTLYSYALESFTNAGCADASDFLDRMITVDYIINDFPESCTCLFAF